jgi:hypothetical protein
MLEFWVPCSRLREHALRVITANMLTRREHGTRSITVWSLLLGLIAARQHRTHWTEHAHASVSMAPEIESPEVGAAASQSASALAWRMSMCALLVVAVIEKLGCSPTSPLSRVRRFFPSRSTGNLQETLALDVEQLR